MGIPRTSHLAVILIALFFLQSCAKVPIEGQPAPDFQLERFDGGTLALSAWKGRPIILYWFASW